MFLLSGESSGVETEPECFYTNAEGERLSLFPLKPTDLVLYNAATNAL
jgi:hypothetical protein